LMNVEHSSLGKITIPGPPLRIDGIGEIGHRPDPLAPPLLGEHTDAILSWLDSFDG
jgi:crotonobetainyl-CoA:carnitine CoA-transferase CaiB-like acyl-CoA transferase